MSAGPDARAGKSFARLEQKEIAVISHLQNPAFRQPRDAAVPAALRTTIGSTLLAGALIFGAAPPAAATPTFGAFANVSFAGNSGGWGEFDASKSWTASNVQTGYTVAAVANLATGSLHASSLMRRDCVTFGCPLGAGAGADARLFDRYYFTNDGENAALIPVSLLVEGNCAGDAHKFARYRFAFSSSPINIDAVPYRDLPCDGSVDVVAPINLVSFLGDTSWYAFVELTTGVDFNPFEGGFGLVDFGHTLKVDIVLPEGITMHSDSGVFPFRRETDVPEPATFYGLGAVIAGLGAARYWVRRGRRNGRS